MITCKSKKRYFFRDCSKDASRYLYITPLWKESHSVHLTSSFWKLLFKIKILSPVTFKCIVLKLLQTEPGLGTTQSTMWVFPVTKTQGDRTSRKAVESSKDESSQRSSLAVFFKKPARHVRPPQNCQNGWNGRESEVADKQTAVGSEGVWKRLIFTSDHHSGGGRQAAVLIGGWGVSPQKRVQGEMRRCWGEINVSE